MRILHTVESYLPRVHGMSEVVRQLSERLAAWGHEVVVATSGDAARTQTVIQGVQIVEFALTGNSVRGIWGDKAAYQEFLLGQAFDVVVFFAAQQWATDLALPILDQIPGKKVIVPTGFSGLFQWEYRTYYQTLQTVFPGFDWAVFLSNDYRDVNWARALGYTRWSLIPNGADEREFHTGSAPSLRQKLGIATTARLMTLVGSHTGKKGHKEAIQILKALKTSQEVVLLIAGNQAPPAHGAHRLLEGLKAVAKRLLRYQGGGDCHRSCRRQARHWHQPRRQLLVESLTRAETVQAYREADLFLFPSNIECSPIVLFEACAAGVPFFAAEVGNAQEIAQWTGGGRILPTRQTKDGLSRVQVGPAAQQLDPYLDHPELLVELGQAGQRAWRQRFTWQGIARQYEDLYTRLTHNA